MSVLCRESGGGVGAAPVGVGTESERFDAIRTQLCTFGPSGDRKKVNENASRRLNQRHSVRTTEHNNTLRVRTHRRARARTPFEDTSSVTETVLCVRRAGDVRPLQEVGHT